jgi:hypothetical protein
VLAAHSAHDVAPGPAAKRPAGHGEQRAAPVPENVPAPQSAHASPAALKRPAAHGVHVLARAGLLVPGGHAVHALAPAALLNVARQLLHAVPPPALNCPAAHSTQPAKPVLFTP